MNTTALSRKYRLVLTLLSVLSVMIFADNVTSQNRGLTDQEKRGKQIYLKGESGLGTITAVLGNTDLEVPASAFSCANCHGRRGEGTREGGLQPPPIDWETLTAPYTSVLTRHQRAAYDDATLPRAITHGLDPAESRLHPAMPRYRMTREQMADLIAYLKQVGKESDRETGVTDDTIKVGAALPLSGSLAGIGEDIKAILLASFADINDQGGIYGRRCELVVEDSGRNSMQTLEATRRLMEQGIFALVASFEPGDSSNIHELIKGKEVPLVGPLTLSPRVTLPPNPYIFYFFPTFADQVRTLVDFANVRAQGKSPRLAVIYSRNDFNQDALSGLRAQAKVYSMEIVSEQEYEAGKLKAREAVELLKQKQPADVFFFGSAPDFKAVTDEIYRAKLNVNVFSSVVMIGRAAFALPPNLSAQTFLSYPSSFPNESELTEFLALTRKAHLDLRNPAFQSMAFAAVKIFSEAAKLSGRQLVRAAFIDSLERLYVFKTSVIPPVTFGPNRRVGSVSSYVVGIDVRERRYVPLTDRLAPKDKPQR
jgi:ABC-type branched-subunit amino acid transport system substrate-binding protein